MDYTHDTSQSSTSDSFDQDFSQPDTLQTDTLFHNPVHVTEAYTAHHPIHGNILHLEYEDPLKYSGNLTFEPLTIKLDPHFVHPHEVSGYERQDGTYVEGYYRDGDGDTSVNRTVEQGGGYFSR
ncbi:hypothetical protein [Sporosarcina trichiuri]|uniref:hypothetical protein n=1 Tax=Sporosarcina trichiuri TaxID=3056445 RepID=UPI0025B35C50|nr:hypothetical protein [Sporosarcina sp. 0.2-SM1T-5]WJY26434.1 hypothetical protein QWT68_10105 [Sporosarcina sp. 0.2-SM1T-5]